MFYMFVINNSHRPFFSRKIKSKQNYMIQIGYYYWAYNDIIKIQHSFHFITRSNNYFIFLTFTAVNLGLLSEKKFFKVEKQRSTSTEVTWAYLKHDMSNGVI